MCEGWIFQKAQKIFSTFLQIKLLQQTSRRYQKQKLLCGWGSPFCSLSSIPFSRSLVKVRNCLEEDQDAHLTLHPPQVLPYDKKKSFPFNRILKMQLFLDRDSGRSLPRQGWNRMGFRPFQLKPCVILWHWLQFPFDEPHKERAGTFREKWYMGWMAWSSFMVK